MAVKLIVIAGPPSVGKTAVVKQIIKHIKRNNGAPAYLKVDVVVAFEDIELKEEYNIPTKKVYSGDLCPDHMGIMVIRDAMEWAEKEGADTLIYESAGLCLRCTPYISDSLGICVISAVFGTHAPLKMAPMIGLSDVVVVTKTDLISQAEKEVFREQIRKVSPELDIIETNAIQGTGMQYLMKVIDMQKPMDDLNHAMLRGIPPLGVCTICVGKKEIGWQNHFGVIRRLEDDDNIYRGE
ncbi:MAG: GTP-binding protein [Candidatus Methanomethylophilaceae archaeon]|nr:cobalamin biosynthesis protein [Candidatus Methanomethylophilaceae archaeon]MDD3378866.1 GTP-binding protein [Candidatus Methanomethylophilaceae archaeon]MDY0224105.1 GTP-binding protein [Candidatus Methanomethylophilaceae archaeon]